MGVTLIAALSMCLALVSRTPVHAGIEAWPVDGVPVAPGGATQLKPLAIEDGSGGAFVAWTEVGQDARVCVQHLRSDGTVAAGWPRGGLRPGAGPSESYPGLAADGAGGVFVAWRQVDHQAFLRVQRFTSGGAIAAGWPQGGRVLVSAASMGNVVTLPDGAGGLFIASDLMVTLDDTSGVHVFRLDADDAVHAGWPVDGVQFPSSGSFIELAPDGAGGVFVAWGNNGTGLTQLGRLGEDGAVAAGWPAEGRVVLEDLESVPLHLIADRSGGGYLVLRTGGEAVVTRVGADGNDADGWGASGRRVCTDCGWENPRLALDASDGVFVGWVTIFGYDVRLSRFGPSGGAVEGWPSHGVGVCEGTGNQRHVRMASDGAGGMFLVWEDDRHSTTGPDIYMHHVRADGGLVEGWPYRGLPICTAPSEQFQPCVVGDGSGGAIFFWVDLRAGAEMIYAARVTEAGATPLSFPGSWTSIGPEHVALVWTGTPSGAWDAVVERRAPPETWQQIGSPTWDGGSTLRFEDFFLDRGGEGLGRPGAHLEYRVVLRSNGSLLGDGFVAIDIPLATPARLAFAPAASGALGALLELPDAAGARLDVYDVQGARVTSRDLRSLGAGIHRITLDGTDRLASGVYFGRLRWRGGGLSVRTIFVR